MRIGTTAAVLAIAVALAGCGGSPAHRHSADSITTTPADAAAVIPLGPGSNPQAVVVNTATVPDDDQVLPQPVALPSCPEGPTVHFTTPQAAMTYLAAAWNRDDLAALCQVTNPNARFLLNDMHREAVNLRLKRCASMGDGGYACTFVHDYPARMHKTGTGRSWMTAEPADNPGWYMAGYVGCG